MTAGFLLGDRFWSKVAPAEPFDCWVWAASRFATGYGQYKLDGKNCKAHRLAYLDLVGEIPDGLVLDHLCRNRACVNPYHLDPVTHTVNVQRGDTHRSGCRQREKAHCPAGHAYDEANTYVYPSGARACRACMNKRNLANYYRRRANGWTPKRKSDR